MSDMTAEQALEWLQTIAAISTAVVSDRPLSFSYQEAVKFQAAVKALTAPKVLDLDRDAYEELRSIIDGGSESMTHSDAVEWCRDHVAQDEQQALTALRERVKVLESALKDQLNDCINFDGGKLTDGIMEKSTAILRGGSDK
jgi:hypothetical protein